MFIPIDLPLADGSTLPVFQWAQDRSDGHTDSDNGHAVPLILVSSDDSADTWDALAEHASGRWRVTACHAPTANRLLQAVWSIGEPAVVCANGVQASVAALCAQAAAHGAIPLVVLIDFASTNDRLPDGAGPGRVAIIRGRQSEEATHADAVRARLAIGGRCKLVELENCGDNAAASCPAEFEAAISWLMFGE